MEKVLHKRLADYAASLSGVLLLQPAQGQIIVHSAEPYLEGAVDQPVSLDFNDDGFTELEFLLRKRMWSISDPRKHRIMTSRSSL